MPIFVLRPLWPFRVTVAAFGWRARFIVVRPSPAKARPDPHIQSDRDRLSAQAALSTRLSPRLRRDVGAGEG